MKRAVGVIAAVAVFVAPVLAAAGTLVVGGGLSVGSPSGAFGDVAGTGFGFAAQGVYYFGPGPLAFRVSGTGSWYGSERLPILGSSDFSVEASPTTFVLVGGPQLAKREGNVRPYANLLAGWAHFSTTAKMDIAGFSFAADDEFQDDVFAWSAGAGVLVPLGPRVNLDVGARYTGTGEAELVGLAGFVRENSNVVFPALMRDSVHTFEGLIGVTFAF